MGIGVFSAEYLNTLVASASVSPRLRQHRNIHSDYSDPCQRLFNAIEPGSYIRPHKHSQSSGTETMLAVRGRMALLAFDDGGVLEEAIVFGVDGAGEEIAAGVHVPAGRWHTVIAFSPGSILLETKAGPFDAERPKELAPWAPDEGTSAGREYLDRLVAKASELRPA